MIGRQPGDVKVTYADISKGQTELGFKAGIGIEECLEKYLDLSKQYNAYSCVPEANTILSFKLM